MNVKNDKFDNSKEKFACEAKNIMGRITRNEHLELRGKLQSAKALAGWGSTPLKRCIMRQLQPVGSTVPDSIDYSDCQQQENHG